MTEDAKTLLIVAFGIGAAVVLYRLRARLGTNAPYAEPSGSVNNMEWLTGIGGTIA